SLNRHVTPLLTEPRDPSAAAALPGNARTHGLAITAHRRGADRSDQDEAALAEKCRRGARRVGDARGPRWGRGIRGNVPPMGRGDEVHERVRKMTGGRRRGVPGDQLTPREQRRSDRLRLSLRTRARTYA